MRNILPLSPVLGTAVFVVLYFLATMLYPGGSQADEHAVGFSWINNYWCNLLNKVAINGQPNPARPVAVAAMVVLCFTLTFFWFLFSRQIEARQYLRRMIPICGSLSMITAVLLMSDINHDLVINVASMFGLLATIGTYVGLYRLGWNRLLGFGLLNLLLVVANNYVYDTKGLIIYLPVIQKISFASFLTWICLVDLALFHRCSPTRQLKDKSS